MAHSMSLKGMGQALGVLLSPVFAVAAIVVGTSRAPAWGVAVLLMAAALISLMAARRLRPEPNDAETREPARRLVELLENAPKLPIVSARRVDSPQVYELVAELRSGDGVPQAVLTAAEVVDDAVRHAMPVPLTDEVRLPPERVAELVASLRAAGA
jgi:hypothetical protein